MQTITNAEPRCYFASLTDYNAGTLHGVWVDMTQDTDEIWQDIRDMLAASPEAAAFPQGGPAEEWAIHDHESFHGIPVSEWADVDSLADIAAALVDIDDPAAFAAYYANESRDDTEEVLEQFTEDYRGHFDSEREYAEQWAEDFGLPVCGEGDRVSGEQLLSIWGYIDFDHVAHELNMASVVWTVAAQPFGVYVFDCR